MGWNKIGTAANSIAIYANRIVALTPDCKRVFMRDPSTYKWIQIGGPARSLIGGGWDLYAESPDGKAIYRYDGKDWSNIGDGALQFTGIGNALYKLEHKSRDVYRYDRYENKWSKIGGAAHAIIGGGSKVYASSPDKNAIWEYNRYLDSWTKIGTAAHSWVGVGETVYGLTPDKSAVYRYDGIPNNWTKVGGPALELIGGGSSLYAIQPKSKDIWKYSGTGMNWSKIGTPGVSIVASEHRLYSMTLDRKAVYEYLDENKETQRLRKLLYGAFKQEIFGHRIMRGFMIKEAHGQVLAEHNANVAYQPLSVLKLLPYFHAISEIDNGNSSLDKTIVNWFQLASGDSNDINNTACLQEGDTNVIANSAPLRDALGAMMWFSHNRSLDAVMEHYGIRNITRRAQDLGLKQTEMYYGCVHADISVRRWPSNMTTLYDLAELFEGVENLKLVKKSSSRQIWRENMIQATPLPGINYFSPILNMTTGFWNTDELRGIVGNVAGISPAGMIDEFMQYVSYRKKGGGGGPTANEVGQGDFRELSLPFKNTDGSIYIKKFLIGHYLYQRRSVFELNEEGEPWENPENPAIASQNTIMRDFEMELYRLPITMALATW